MVPKSTISLIRNVTSLISDVTFLISEMVLTSAFTSFLAKSVLSTAVKEVENRVFMVPILIKTISLISDVTFLISDVILMGINATSMPIKMADFPLNNIPSFTSVKTFLLEAPFLPIKIASMLAEMAPKLGQDKTSGDSIAIPRRELV